MLMRGLGVKGGEGVAPCERERRDGARRRHAIGDLHVGVAGVLHVEAPDGGETGGIAGGEVAQGVGHGSSRHQRILGENFF